MNPADKKLLLRVARAIETRAEQIKGESECSKVDLALRDRLCLDARDLREYVKRVEKPVQP